MLASEHGQSLGQNWVGTHMRSSFLFLFQFLYS